MKKAFLLFTLGLLGAAAFAQSNVAVLLAAASTNNTAGSVIILDPSTVAQPSPVATFAIPSTGAMPLRFSGSATSTGYLSNNADRTLVTFTGANTDQTAANANTYLTRGVGTFNSVGTYNLAATYTGVSGQQTRSATTLNNTDYFIADQSGLYTNGTTTPSPTGNFRAIKTFGGAVYVGQASGTPATVQIATIPTTSGGTAAGLPGLANNATHQDFYLIQSGSNSTSYDVLYILSASSNTVGSIAKFSLVGGTWTANGTYTMPFGGFGLYAEPATGGANLYVTTGQGALATNNLVRLADATGFNTAISITTANNVILYTAPMGSILKGVAMAPLANPVPLRLTSFSAQQQAGDVLANWTTSNEQSVSHFRLERSADGVQYRALGRIAPANTAGDNQYHTTDTAPLLGKNFYRVASVDADGSIHYSAVVTVLIGGKGEATGLHVTPNPVQHSFTLVHPAAAAGARIMIADIHGRVVAERTPAPGSTTTGLSAQDLPVGTYMATFEDAGERHQAVFVK